MRAYGTGGPPVGARGTVELPDPDAPSLLPRTWVPAARPVEHHSPYCRSRCCRVWRPTLPTPPRAPLAGRGGQAPTLPQPRRTSTSPTEPAAEPAGLPAEPSVTAGPGRARALEASLAVARAGLAVPCAGGCGAKVAAAYVLRTRRDWHGCCPAPVEPAAVGGAR